MFSDTDQTFLNVILNFFKGVSWPPPAYLAQTVERKTFNLVAEGSTPSVGMLLVSLGGYDTWFSPKRRGFESRTRNFSSLVQW
jgi:hypothetical protein